jgi:hypothetical protein
MNPFYHTEIIRVNSLGNIDTIVEINTTGPQINAKRLSNSDFIVSVITQLQTAPFDDALNIRKYNFNLSEVDSLIYGKSDTNETECQSSIDFIDTIAIFVGGTSNWQTTPFASQINYLNIAKINSNLQPYWEKYLSRGNDCLNLWKVLATNDGGVLLAGTSYNDTVNGPFERDIYVIKLDSTGNFVTGVNEPALQQHEVLVFPNPVQDNITIKVAIQFGEAEFTMYDNSGREVLRKKFKRQATVPVHQLSPGMYVYSVKGSSGKEERGKVVKQ